MAVIVPALEELREQINRAFPNRDKATDGGIGDESHSGSVSSHNPDDQGKPEWDGDPDKTPEVRARDFDSDLRTPGVSTLDLVKHLVAGAKSGRFWWLRYIIYDRKIYHKRNNWEPQNYTGPSPHTGHFHVNNDFSQAADQVRGVDYHLEELFDMALSAEDRAFIVDAIQDHVYSAWNQDKIRRYANDVPAVPTNTDNGYITPASALSYIQKDANYIRGLGLKAVLDAVAAVAAKVDLSPAEVEAIRTALDVPTAQENADATVAALGGLDSDELAEILRNILGPEKTAELKAAL